VRWSVVVAVLAGCLRPAGEFRCATENDCATPGSRCEPEGFCSFADPDCSSGVRFGPHSGAFSNRCVNQMIDAGIDTPVDVAIDGPTPLGPWGTAVELTALSSTDDDSDPSLTGDGLEIFFYSDRPNGAGGADLYHATRATTSAAFSNVQRITELATTGNEYSPEISDDGLTLYFTSSISGEFEVYSATRPDKTTAFGTPPTLETQLSSTDDDFTIGVSTDGLVAVTGQDTAGNGRELFIHTRASTAAAWSTGTRITELGSASDDEVGGSLDATGLNIMFHSDRGQVAGRFDLWTAKRTSTSAAFDAPTPITELNTSGSAESNPFVSSNLRRMVYASNAAGGDRDIYETTR